MRADRPTVIHVAREQHPAAEPSGAEPLPAPQPASWDDVLNLANRIPDAPLHDAAGVVRAFEQFRTAHEAFARAQGRDGADLPLPRALVDRIKEVAKSVGRGLNYRQLGQVQDTLDELCTDCHLIFVLRDIIQRKVWTCLSMTIRPDLLSSEPMYQRLRAQRDLEEIGDSGPEPERCQSALASLRQIACADPKFDFEWQRQCWEDFLFAANEMDPYNGTYGLRAAQIQKCAQLYGDFESMMEDQMPEWPKHLVLARLDNQICRWLSHERHGPRIAPDDFAAMGQHLQTLHCEQAYAQWLALQSPTSSKASSSTESKH